jgi:hypothetical protein
VVIASAFIDTGFVVLYRPSGMIFSLPLGAFSRTEGPIQRFKKPVTWRLLRLEVGLLNSEGVHECR